MHWCRVLLEMTAEVERGYTASCFGQSRPSDGLIQQNALSRGRTLCVLIASMDLETHWRKYCPRWSLYILTLEACIRVGRHHKPNAMLRPNPVNIYLLIDTNLHAELIQRLDILIA